MEKENKLYNKEGLVEKIEVKEKLQIVREITKSKKIFFIPIFSLIIAVLFFIFYKNIIYSIIAFFSAIAFSILFIYFRAKIRKTTEIRKIESIFPDFLQLMASNLRAGMTIDRAMLSSSRPEFSPLDKEILNTGKEITTGRSVESALLGMSKNIKSEKIHKTILLIISGIKSGGNLATLLEETSVNMRERDFVEKRAGSNVLMYVIFIFLTVTVGAPTLFSLSNILVEVLTNVLAGMPPLEAPMQARLPFTLSSISLPISFIKYFSLVFIIVTNILASFVLGLVSKGDEKEGLKYLLPMLLISISVFFVIKIFLSKFVAGLFG